MPCAVTPQGRVSFALSVLRGHLFVLIRFGLLCFGFVLFWFFLFRDVSMRSGGD